MKHTLALTLLGAMFVCGTAFAADPIVGSWKLNVAKSTFNPGPAPKAATRTYTEAAGLYTLDQKITGADGKENLLHVQYRDGQEVKTPGASVDSTVAKKLDVNNWDFDVKMGGKVVGHVHRSVSADGKVLTVHNTGQQGNTTASDDTMVFDRQ
jgi:hypothetical protein